MGRAELNKSGPLVCGSWTSLTYTAGHFGIDDLGGIKVSIRSASDQTPPQFDDPAAPGVERRLFVRVIFEDGHIAWTSPIYLARNANQPIKSKQESHTMPLPSLSRALFVALAASVATAPVMAQDTPIISAKDRFFPVIAQNGMVASQNAQSTQTGVDILQAGGNAVDAAVAIGFSLAVTLPKAGNLGGGGFLVGFNADSDDAFQVNFRSEAPSSAFRDMQLGADGEVDEQMTRQNGSSSGIPGTVAGLIKAHEEFGSGKLTLAELIAPAIDLAENGFVINQDMAFSFARAAKRLTKDPEAISIFYGEDGAPPQIGDVVTQPELAEVLKKIAAEGRDGFYKGEVAEAIAATMQANKGVMTAEDLAGYEAILGEPVTGTYKGYDIVSMNLPSSGGIHLVQMLNMLENADLTASGHNSAATVHLMAETMRRAYADRSEYLGDLRFTDVPVTGLTSKDYAKQLFDQISLEAATPSPDIGPGKPLSYESNETTHYSVVDKDRNAVAVTYTLGFPFGSGLIADGTGIFMNNVMGGFSAKPGAPNAFGLLGKEANAIEAGKRPLSSMTPTIVLKDGEVFLVTGSPGGSRIITTVLQVILNVIDHGMNIAEATSAVRIHHQWYPDEIRVEEGFPVDTTRILEGMGHKVVVKDNMGSTQSIMVVDSALHGASDPRRDGARTIGY